MINWFDMPAEGLSNGGLFEIKELEVTENGTYEQSGEMYNKVTVNVEGGGGSSDFSTASVTVTVGAPSSIQGVCITKDEYEEYIDTFYQIETSEPQVITAVLYKGESVVKIQTEGIINVSGNIQQLAPNAYNITGDCSITIS